MANTSHTTYLILVWLWPCHCRILWLPLSFFLAYSLPHFILSPASFPFLFLGNILFCVCTGQSSYNCSLLFQKECLKQTILLKWPIVCWPQKVRRWWRGNRVRELEMNGLMDRWANRTEDEVERNDDRREKVVSIKWVMSRLSTPAFTTWPPFQRPHCNVKTIENTSIAFAGSTLSHKNSVYILYYMGYET